MKTRTLLLLALGCGIAIMVAGAALFVRLATQAEIKPAAEVGQTVTVGDLSVVVDAATETDGVLAVSIRADGVDGDITSDFRLIASGRRVDPQSEPCVTQLDKSSTCVLHFDVSVADGTSRVLFVERGDQQARWIIST